MRRLEEVGEERSEEERERGSDRAGRGNEVHVEALDGHVTTDEGTGDVVGNEDVRRVGALVTELDVRSGEAALDGSRGDSLNEKPLGGVGILLLELLSVGDVVARRVTAEGATEGNLTAGGELVVLYRGQRERRGKTTRGWGNTHSSH